MSARASTSSGSTDRPASGSAARGPAPRRQTFPKTRRLKRQRLIRSLFDRQRTDVDTVAVGSVRLLFRVIPRAEAAHDVPVKIGFAPGRRVRNAVKRNRIRRLLREVYRQHQHVLTECFARSVAPSSGAPQTLIVMALFRGDPARAAETVPRDLPEALRRVAHQFRPSAPGAGLQ